jgi:hypothetical protein
MTTWQWNGIIYKRPTLSSSIARWFICKANEPFTSTGGETLLTIQSWAKVAIYMRFLLETRSRKSLEAAMLQSRWEQKKKRSPETPSPIPWISVLRC